MTYRLRITAQDLVLLRNTVAVSIREAGFDVASMAKTSTKVFVLEVMDDMPAGLPQREDWRQKKKATPPILFCYRKSHFKKRRSCDE